MSPGRTPFVSEVARLAIGLFDDVLNGIADALEDPTVGAQLGWLVPIGAFGIIDYIGATAADPHTSHRAVCRYLDTVASTDMRYTYAQRWVIPKAEGDLRCDFLAALLVPRGRAAFGGEPFIRIQLQPGEEQRWSSDHRYHVPDGSELG